MLIHIIPSLSSYIKGVYAPKCVILHAALLHQTFVHCAIFPTAASRRSLVRVSVPVWRIILSDPLCVIGLVSHYPTNYLIQHRPIPQRKTFPTLINREGVSSINHRFQWLSQTKGHVTYALLTRAPLVSRSKLLCYRSTCMC